MGKDIVHRLANIHVINVESEYLRQEVELYNGTIGTNEAEVHIENIERERKRLHPKKLVDEEEVIIRNLK